MLLLQDLVVLIFAPAALLGVISNWLVVIATCRSRSLSPSFSLLTANQAFFNGLYTTLCLFYVTPMIALDSQFLIDNSKYCGFVMLICYDASIHAHFLITINRFSAVFLPLVYVKFFISKWTKLLIIISLLSSLGFMSYFFQYLPCRLYYVPEIWMFTLTDDIICWTFQKYGIVLKIAVVSLFDVCLDVITIWKVRKIKKQMRRGQPQVAACQKKEIDCLRQSFAQSLFGFLFPNIGMAPLFVRDNVVFFICGLVTWCLLHSMDGFIALCFNSEIRKALKPRKQSSVVAGSSVSMAMAEEKKSAAADQKRVVII